MLLDRNQPFPFPPPDGEPLTGLVRTHWMLAVCVVCGHERVHGERHRASCPTCGAQLHSFSLYRDLQAGR
jgi:rubrerythrin